MKHNIRINGKVQELDCELGSDILDKNGHEIFEGNLVKTINIQGERVRPVVFKGGKFYLKDWDMQPLDMYWEENLQIVD